MSERIMPAGIRSIRTSAPITAIFIPADDLVRSDIDISTASFRFLHLQVHFLFSRQSGSG
jgi:hypothetical protein